MSLSIILWFVASVVCDVAGQICLKIGADDLPSADPRALVRGVASSGWVLAGVLIYALEIVVWLRILAEVPLSIAFPIASINFLGVTFASALVLKERVGARQWLGAFLITCGVVIVAHTA